MKDNCREIKLQPGNRREFMRVPFKTEVEVRARRNLIRSESGINISMRGLRMEYGGVLPIGTSCSASVILHASEERIAIEASGTVVRSEPGILAVEFSRLDPDSYAHLRQLIQYNAADPEKAEQEFAAHRGIKRRSE